MQTANTTETPDLLQRPCDDCGQVYFYESIRFGSTELGHTVQPRCQCCDQKLQEAEARRIDAERRARIQRDIEASLPIDILETDPDYPTFNRDLWSIVQKWRPNRERLWLFIHGPADQCKTRCLALLFKKIMWSGVKCAWSTAGQIQEAARERSRFGSSHDTTTAKESIRSWMRAPYLFIDDLGKNDWPKEFESLFFQILDHRKTHRLPIIFSSNANPDTIGLLISDLNRDPIVSRLRDRTTLINLRPA